MAQMEAVLYVLALKFLKTEQVKSLKEMMNMTVLSEMFIQDGIEIGEAKGETRMAELVKRLMTDKRLDEIELAVDSEEVRKRLYEEYGLV